MNIHPQINQVSSRDLSPVGYPGTPSYANHFLPQMFVFNPKPLIFNHNNFFPFLKFQKSIILFFTRNFLQAILPRSEAANTKKMKPLKGQ